MRDTGAPDAGPVTAEPAVEPDAARRRDLAALVESYARHRPVRTITVLGNAPLSVCGTRAARIDGCDLVIRTTTFALDPPGSPGRYGRRADVVVLHRGTRASPWLFHDYRRRLYLLVEPGRMHWEREEFPYWWPSDLGYVPVSNRDWAVPLADLAGYRVRERAEWATTGTTAVYLATELFPTAEVAVAGFSLTGPATDGRPEMFTHAWGAPVPISAEHRVDQERALLRRWRRSGRIEVLE